MHGFVSKYDINRQQVQVTYIDGCTVPKNTDACEDTYVSQSDCTLQIPIVITINITC